MVACKSSVPKGSLFWIWAVGFVFLTILSPTTQAARSFTTASVDVMVKDYSSRSARNQTKARFRWWRARRSRRNFQKSYSRGAAFFRSTVPRATASVPVHHHFPDGLIQQAISSSIQEIHDQWKKGLEKQRDLFFERVSLISSWLVDEDGTSDEEDKLNHDPDDITHQSNLEAIPPRSIHIVTTAALPWMTGTAVNPLLRAAYLYQRMVEREQANVKNDTGMVQTLGSSNVSVTLVIPWLELPKDQQELYNQEFSDPAEQEAFIRKWLIEQANLPEYVAQGLGILFYPSRYHYDLKSIFAMGDLIQDVILAHNTTELDVCILEEPEHCNWFRAPGDGWKHSFHYVVGIIHTNYKEYAASAFGGLGLWTAPALAMICSAMVRAYCHKVIKLSDTLQTFSPGREVTSNVHGVRQEFWEQGLDLSRRLEHHQNEHSDNDHELLQEPRVYFLGKLLWAKGLDLLLELQEYYKQCVGSYFEMDIYGSGPDSPAIQRAFNKKSYSFWSGNSTKIPSLPASTLVSSSSFQSINKLGSSLHIMAKQHLSNIKNSLPLDVPKTGFVIPPMPLLKSKESIPAHFLGRVDHARLPHDYTIFVNPSISEVLCTATAEALAMGKFVIIPYHPSNYWFNQFPNCLPFRNKLEFVANLRWALSHNPEPLTEEQARQFSWQAATDRLFKASAMTHREAHLAMDMNAKLEGERIAWFHNEVLGKGSRGDLIRKLLGAGPVSEQVRYQQAQKEDLDTKNDDSLDDEDDGGLGRGFSGSWFARTVQTTWSDMAKGFGTAS